MLHSLQQLSERWLCHIWSVGRMKYASLEANLGVGQGLLDHPILPFSLLHSGRSLDMTEILFTGTLSLNSIKKQKLLIPLMSHQLLNIFFDQIHGLRLGLVLQTLKLFSKILWGLTL